MLFLRLKNWSAWKNVNGQTKAIRRHLQSEHGKVWKDMVLLKQLKNWETLEASTTQAPDEREEFSLPGLYESLVKWIAVDDQACLSFISRNHCSFISSHLMLWIARNSVTCSYSSGLSYRTRISPIALKCRN
ncbi:hypothetical protein B0H13DRAFT_2110220 [Mycena leptocephala]|nr:hypothetical protein B0H13DRAFT_2110220 [Mycena leptocephala]